MDHHVLGIDGYRDCWTNLEEEKLIEPCQPNIELLVRTDRADSARWLLKDIGCKFYDIVEIKSDPDLSRGALLFVMECPENHKDKAVDVCFHTFIRNPEFQRYYEPRSTTSVVERNLDEADKLKDVVG